MYFFFGCLLTIVSIFAILKIRKAKTLQLKKIIFRQSFMHETLKDLLPSNSELRQDKKTQSRLHIEKTTTRFIKTPDNKVYWVVGNTFYCADLIDGSFDPAEAKPVNTENMSKKQLDELLFILDNLKNG